MKKFQFPNLLLMEVIATICILVLFFSFGVFSVNSKGTKTDVCFVSCSIDDKKVYSSELNRIDPEISHFSNGLVEVSMDHSELVQTIYEISSLYENVDPIFVEAIIWAESRGQSDVVSPSGAVGLMQIVPKWHRDRMARLGISDLFDAQSNIYVGVDYISELFSISNDPYFVAMAYNGGVQYAANNLENGVVTSYARSVLNTVNEIVDNGDVL